MNFIKLMLISSSLLLIGCGSSNKSSKSSESKIKEEIPINNIVEAKKGLNSFSSFQSSNISQNNLQNSVDIFRKMQKGTVHNLPSIYDYIKLPLSNIELPKIFSKQEKSEEKECRDGGTSQLYLSDDKENLDMELTFKNCKVGTSLINGKMRIYGNKEQVNMEFNFVAIEIENQMEVNFTWILKPLENHAVTILSNGVIKKTNSENETSTQIVDNVLSKFTILNSDIFWTIKGEIALESKCFTGTYHIQTVEDITIRNYKRNSSISSGILKVNTATYTYEDPYVTVETKDETKTILQNELKREKAPDYTCSE